MLRYAFLFAGILLALITLWAWSNYRNAKSVFDAKEREYHAVGRETNPWLNAWD